MVAAFPFFVGSGRSGTTLLRAMFDSHPQMAIPPESHFILPLSKRNFGPKDSFDTERFLDDLEGNSRFRRWELDPETIRAELRSTPVPDFSEAIRRVFAAYARTRGKTRYGDKTPRYVSHLPELAELFPEARFVHLIRDGRDVALSILEAGWGGVKGTAEAAWLWKQRTLAGRTAGMTLPAHRYTEIKYEDLVADPENVLRALCSWIEISFDAQMLAYYDRAQDVLRGIRSPQRHSRIFLPPTRGLRNWRADMSLRDVELFEAVAGDLLADLGYERRFEVPSGCARFRAQLTRLRSAASRIRSLASRADAP